MRILLDSSVLVDVLRNDARAVGFLAGARRSGDELWSVTPVRTEILTGMRPGEEHRTRALFDLIDWQPITIEIADRAGDLARTYRVRHPSIEMVDYLVAAGTYALAADLATHNVRDFPMFPGLQPPY